MDDADPLTARLTGAMLVLMKGSNAEVMEVAAEYDLSLSQLRALFTLEHSDEDLAVNELAERIGLSMPATGRAVDALHRSGLVSRREDATDRRIKRLALTALGEDATARIATARIAAVQNLVNGCDDGERARLDEASRTLSEIVAKHLPSHAEPGTAAPTAGAGSARPELSR